MTKIMQAVVDLMAVEGWFLVLPMGRERGTRPKEPFLYKPGLEHTAKTHLIPPLSWSDTLPVRSNTCSALMNLHIFENVGLEKGHTAVYEEGWNHNYHYYSYKLKSLVAIASELAKLREAIRCQECCECGGKGTYTGADGASDVTCTECDGSGCCPLSKLLKEQ